jgi:hypothetical protein
VIDDRKRGFGPPCAAPRFPQTGEGLRTGVLVEDVPIDIQKHMAAAEFTHGVCLNKLVVQGGGCVRVAHGVIHHEHAAWGPRIKLKRDRETGAGKRDLFLGGLKIAAPPSSLSFGAEREAAATFI